MSKRHGWLSPDVVDGHETICISLNIPVEPAHRAAFWGAITELARDHNWDTGGDEQKAADLATYWRHLIFEGLTEDCSMAGVVDVRLNGQVLEKTFDGETWEEFATLQQITSAVAQTLEPGENATISLVDGVLTVGIPRGADGADGTNGLPGAPGDSVELRVDGGWVQWRQSDDDPTWTNLFEIPAGGGGAPADITTKTIFVSEQIYRATLGAAGQFDVNFGPNDYDHFTVNLKARASFAATARAATMYINGDSNLTGNNYYSQRAAGNNGAAQLPEAASPNIGVISGNTAPANEFGRVQVTILYAGDDKPKSAQGHFGAETSATDVYAGSSVMTWNGAAPITRLSFSDSNGLDFMAGSELQILGWKNVEVVTDLDGGGMYKGDQGEPGADGTDGTDGREIEMQAVQDENGVCQAIQWRYAGDLEWLTLVNTPVCEEPAAPPQNLQMNRCGVAVALTAELERLYTRVKLDPTLWDTLEGYAATVESGGQTTAIVATLVGAIVGAPVAASVAAFGGALAAGAAFLRWVFNAGNSGVNEWTIATTEHLTAALYCVLTRRETITITADVLREWVSFAADAPINGDNDTLISLISVVPVSYWANEAAVAQPDINSCLDPCTTRTGQWCTEIGALGGDTLTFDDPIVRATSSILIGRVAWDTPFNLHAVPTPLDTLLYSITLNFGRNIVLGGLDIGITYLQSVNTTSPAIIVTDNAGNSYGQVDVTGITDPFGAETELRWRASETTQLSSLTITGKVAVADVDNLTTEMLRIDYIRLCGDGYAPYGEAGNNCEGCDPYDPCIDAPSYGYDNCETFQFVQASPCWGGAGWTLGTGLHPTLGVQDPTLKWFEGSLNLGTGDLGGQMTLRRIEIDATYEAASGSNAGSPTLRFVANQVAQVYPVNAIPPTNGRYLYVWEGSVAAPNMQLFYRLWKNTNYPNTQPDSMGGQLDVHRMTIWYDGAPRTWNCD